MTARRVRWGRRAVAVGSGVLLAMSRPAADVGWLALVGLAPLLWLWRTDSPRGAAGHGFLAGATYHAIVVSWAWYFGAIAIVPLVAALAAYWAAAGAVVAVLRRRGLASPWLTAAVWVVAEAAVARFPLGGLSWGELGYAMHDLAPLRALGALGGLPLVSFVVVLGNAALSDAFAGRRVPQDRRRAAAVVALGAVVTASWFVAWPATQVSGRLHLALVQGNAKNRDLTDAELAARYLPASHFALADGLTGRYDLVVFPESSMDEDPRIDSFETAHIVATARRLQTAVLTNAAVDADAAGTRASNLDLLYDHDGHIVGTYAKRHLVPYGEYVPFGSVLRPIIGELSKIPRDFAPGHTRGVLTLPPGADGRAHRIATVICFESAFGYEVRPLVHAGAEVIVVSTNNRSYRRSANSWQHVAIGQMRAAETGRALLQASISGHSAVIDARGNVLSHTALFHNGVLTATVETRTGLTPYVRFGDWALGACLVALLATVASAVFGGRRSQLATTPSVDSAADELVRGAL